MKNKALSYVKNILTPCLVLSLVTGAFTGILIFLFKLLSSYLIELSGEIYDIVRGRPTLLPLLILGAALIGLIAGFILKYAVDCRGGGIPTAVASLRGLLPLKWIEGIVALFASAMMTYLCGVPLGNEGPSVQMGAAVGKGSARLLSRKNRAWDRYAMTGGASAGFAAATGAPITGILFAIEDAHRRISPMIFMVSSLSVITGVTVQAILSDIFSFNTDFLIFSVDCTLPISYYWIAAIVGIVCGICAVLFTKLYNVVRYIMKHKLSRLPITVKVMAVFSLTSVLGFACGELLGSGHSLIEEVIYGNGVWYLLIIYLCVRAFLLIVANNVGVTGGVFVPTLTFGALIGALLGKAAVAIGLLPTEYYVVSVVIGMASFLAASSRTPITALTFSVEALSGITNILPIAGGVAIAYLLVEASGVAAFTDTVLERKVQEYRAGKSPMIVDEYLTVTQESFAVGKEVRDLLLPPTCVILSIHRDNADNRSAFHGMRAGDLLHVHYSTYTPEETHLELEALFGAQTGDTKTRTREGSANHQVPEA